jgi:hypothetical protein
MFQWYPPGAISRAFREVETPKHYLNPIGRIGRLENGVGAEEILSGITCVGTRGVSTRNVLIVGSRLIYQSVLSFGFFAG